MTLSKILPAMLGIAAAAVAFAAQADTAPADTATQDWSVYGNLGYNYLHASPANISVDLGAINARIGARYQKYVGVEVEGAVGVVDQTISGVKVSLDSEIAAYAVAYYPASDKLDLFARIGYGNAKVKASLNGSSASASGDTWNIGAGAQYFMTPKDGIRVEYTRYSSTDSSPADVDSFGVNYVRKF